MSCDANVVLNEKESDGRHIGPALQGDSDRDATRLVADLLSRTNPAVAHTFGDFWSAQRCSMPVQPAPPRDLRGTWRPCNPGNRTDLHGPSERSACRPREFSLASLVHRTAQR